MCNASRSVLINQNMLFIPPTKHLEKLQDVKHVKILGHFSGKSYLKEMLLFNRVLKKAYDEL